MRCRLINYKLTQTNYGTARTLVRTRLVFVHVLQCCSYVGRTGKSIVSETHAHRNRTPIYVRYDSSSGRPQLTTHGGGALLPKADASFSPLASDRGRVLTPRCCATRSAFPALLRFTRTLLLLSSFNFLSIAAFRFLFVFQNTHQRSLETFSESCDGPAEGDYFEYPIRVRELCA